MSKSRDWPALPALPPALFDPRAPKEREPIYMFVIDYSRILRAMQEDAIKDATVRKGK